MAESLVASGRVDLGSAEGGRKAVFDRRTSFLVIYLSIFAFMVLYIVSVEVAEAGLDAHYREEVRLATRVGPTGGPIVPQIQRRVAAVVQQSSWIRIGGVRVNVTVLGADGQTPLYVGGGVVVPPPPAANLDAAMHEALRLLPAISDVFVSVPHGSVLSTGIFVLYGAVLLQGLFLYNRWLARREQELLAEAEAARAGAARRAHSIEAELGQVRTRLRELEPSERSHVQEIRGLEKEREGLRRKLRDLAAREAQLRTSAERSSDLEQEHQALEDLLDEALEDVSQKEAEISSLQDRLKRASKKQSGSSRSRDVERLARRMRTLYKNLSIDDRAIADIAALGDETLKLRAEEGLKRLADDPDTAAVRRKVGGLPPHLSIFELGFAGKGRIYYTRTDGSSYRVLAVGGKATQKTDLEYLSRIP
jgi:hypothetical protein